MNEYFPKDIIEKLERELRFLIHDVLSKVFGADWVYNSNVVSQKQRKGWEKKAEKDKQVQGNECLHELPLFYAEFSELIILLEKHKALFETVFEDYDLMLTYIKIIKGFRNTIKHHRDIAAHQYSLLIGIGEEILSAITLWRIGTKAILKQIVITFEDLISTDGKQEDQILSESRNKIEQISLSIEEALKNMDMKFPSNTKREDYNTTVRTDGIMFEVQTTASANSTCRIEEVNYKKITTRLFYDVEHGIKNLDSLLENLKKRYWVIVYELSTSIDIERLVNWSEEQAGLRPGSSTKFNGQFNTIDYGFLRGKLRVSVSNSMDSVGFRTGKLSLIYDESKRERGYWVPHKYITHNDLLGFVLGNISPRTVMYLHQLSLA